MTHSKKPSVGRRNFLKGTAASAALLAGTQTAEAQQAPPAGRSATAPIATQERDPAPSVEVLTADNPGSDFMVDVLRALGFEYVFSNPGSSFRGLHESLINYGGNKNPEFI